MSSSDIIYTNTCTLSTSTDINYTTLQCSCAPASECTRVVILTILFGITFICCIIQMARIYINTKQLLSYQMAVILVATIEGILGVLHWGFFESVVFNYWITFLKELQLLIITYFFILSALVVFNLRHLERKVLWPTFAIIIIYLFIVVILGSFGVFDGLVEADLECSNLTFILLSTSGLLLSSIFLITGILITRQFKKQSISENIQRKKKLELWALIFVYFITSITSTFEDVLDLFLSINNSSCYLLEFASWAQVIAVFLEHFVNLLIPMWAILIVYNIEASREKGKSLKSIQQDQLDADNNLLEYDYLVGGEFHSVQSYYSIASNKQEI